MKVRVGLVSGDVLAFSNVENYGYYADDDIVYVTIDSRKSFINKSQVQYIVNVTENVTWNGGRID